MALVEGAFALTPRNLPPPAPGDTVRAAMGPSFLRAAAVAAALLAACSSEPNRAAVNDASADDAPDDIASPDVAAAPDAAPDAPRDVAVDRADGATTPPDAAPDVAVDVPRFGPDVPDFEDGGIAGPTYDFVFTGLTIDGDGSGAAPNPGSSTRGLAGFNLDGRFTGPTPGAEAECNHGDFFSELDPDQNMGTCAAGTARGGSGCMGGVDNQLPEIAETVDGFGGDVRGAVAELSRNGQASILVRVSGVDGELGPSLNDDQVTVRVYPVGRPLFDDCAQIGTPGQRYAVDDASLLVAGDLARARFRFNARIVAGRLVTLPTGSATTPDFALDLPLGTAVATLNLFRTQLRFDLTADRALRGNLGGTTPMRDVVAAVIPALPSGVSPAVVNAVIQSFVDTQDPAGDPLGCRYPNGSISLGMGFTGARAVIAPTSVRGPQPGRCGS